MSFWSRLFKKADPPAASAEGATLPMSRSATATGDDVKQQRHHRREALYAMVRETMLRQELLASHYKFKVLSVDSAGRQFLVMMDWLGPQALPLQTLNALEQRLAQSAAQRYDILVKAVYWRQAQSVGDAASVQAKLPAAGDSADHASAAHSAPVGLGCVNAVPADAAAPASQDQGGAEVRPELPPVAAAPASSAALPGYEPIGPDELSAFQAAVAKALPKRSPEGSKSQDTSGPVVPSALGFMDTQILDDEAPEDEQRLSRTQYGDL
ncbi:MAG: hypothetical protein OHK0048_01780 [Rhodoferax sp.]